MIMKLSILFMSLSAVLCRDTNKVFKSMPSISNSFLNFGKMDISFHFNTKPPGINELPLTEIRSEPLIHPPSSFFSKPEPTNEECLCSALYNKKNSFMSNPSDMLNKILRSNDLFSFNKEPLASPSCCESHEHVQEDTVFFEFGPKSGQMEVIQPQQNYPSLPFIFDNFLPKKAPLPNVPMKPKAIEIFFFPNKKDTLQEKDIIVKDIYSKDYAKSQIKKKDLMKKSEIQIVGDKELRNDFKTLKFRPSFSITSFAKKDNEIEKEKQKESQQINQESIDKKQEEITETTKTDIIVSKANAL